MAEPGVRPAPAECPCRPIQRITTNDDLEALTTVDMAMQDLRKAAKPASLESVKKLIHNHPEWEANLNRPCFSDPNIRVAIEESRPVAFVDCSFLLAGFWFNTEPRSTSCLIGFRKLRAPMPAD